MKRLLTLIKIAVLSFLFLRCSSESPLAGNTPTGSETTNGISATVQYPDGTPAAGLQVAILPTNYLAVDSGVGDEIITDTDSLGRFSVAGLESREYTLEILTGAEHGIMISEIAIPGESSVALGTIVLDTVGSLHGSIRMEHIDSTVRLLVAPYGLSRRVTPDSDGHFRFDNLAPGAYQFHVTSTSPRLTGATDLRGTVEPGSAIYLGRTALPIDYRRDSAAVHAFLTVQGVDLSSFDWSNRVGVSNNRIGGLDLCSLGIADLHPSIETLDFVTSLRLSHNPLQSLPSSIVKLNILNLRVNDVGMNELFPEILGFENLILLNARDNRLSRLPDELALQKELRVLYLDGNEFTEFPAVFAEMTWLTDVDLSDNQITSLPDSIARYPRLWHLNVSGNVLTRLPNDLAELPSLEVFEASHNDLTAFPVNVGRMRMLRTLSLAGNGIDMVPPAVGTLPDLKVIHLADNKIPSLPMEITSLSTTDFTIRNNRLCTIPDSVDEWIEKHSTDHIGWRGSQVCD